MFSARSITASAVLAGALVVSGPSFGAEPTGQWDFRLTPYAWLINLNGQMTARGITSDVDVTFGDIVEKSDSLMAFTGLLEARKDRFSLFADVVFADVSFSGSGSRSASGSRSGNPLNRLPNFTGALDATLKLKSRAEIDYTQTIIQSGATYEVASWNNSASRTALDVLGGARYWKQDIDIAVDVSGSIDAELTGQATVKPRNLVRRVLIANGLKPNPRKVKLAKRIAQKKGVKLRNRTKTLERTLEIELERALANAASGDLEWVDPFIGARVRHELGRGRILTLTGDVGGFGAGSDFSWQAVATYAFDVNYFGTPINTVVGYRALAADYSEDGPFGENGFDVIEHGPILGVNLRW